MTTLPQVTRDKWQSNRIDRAGKIELIQKFTERFSVSESLLRKYFNAIRTPTPDRHDWIVAEVDRYYDRYSGQTETPSVTNAPMPALQ